MNLIEPAKKRVIAFIDGQNLFYAAKEAFGYHFPNYDVVALAEAVCNKDDWTVVQVRFYTGFPDPTDDYNKNFFWSRKLLGMKRRGVVTFSRALRYRHKTVKLPDGSKHTILTGEEKGIDVRIAVDVIRLALRGEYDVAVLFSQDQDLSEVADEIRNISNERGRWIKIASAFPCSPASKNRRGIEKTDWIRIDRETYDACIDNRDYRPKRS